MSQQDDNTVTIEVNGTEYEARKGQMLIEVTDEHEIFVPRFCYHRKLSVAANCRMCLVEVEKAPKPLPACATPVADGMKVYTKSHRAISAQKATMEFLLINHPLDCPICDQGGECELQDLAMGFGRGISRYTEKKRVVKDKNLGPLVSTDMTRCIHCTRCVRFGQEIAGLQELGAVGRSENMEITTYVERSVDHELSGNIIDLCPVGALNNKPYRYSARAWEMVARPLVSPHDPFGSNIWGHVLRGKLKRVVPRENDAINETWLADRDRFSCHGLYTEDRLETPMIKRDQEWAEVSWQEALDYAAAGLKDAAADEGDSLGMLVSPSATLEEMYLLRRIGTHLGTRNMDHRLRRTDFADQNADPAWMSLGIDIADVAEQQGILVVGSNLRAEVPMLAHRVRQAALAGAQIGFVNPEQYEYHFRESAYVEAELESFARALAGVLAAACADTGATPPAHVAAALEAVEPGEPEKAAAAVLIGKERAALWLGQIALRHPRFSEIRALAAALAEVTGARLGYITEGANSAAAALAGLLPHRHVGGQPRKQSGLDVAGMMSSPRRAYVVFGVEPDADLAGGERAVQALRSADTVVAFTSYVSDALLECANVLLPTATFAETPGTYVNMEGRRQSVNAAATPVGESRPGWRILRVLGNALELPDCDYQQPSDVLEAFDADCGTVPADNAYKGRLEVTLDAAEELPGVLDVPMYSIDAVVRRSLPLQRTRAAAEVHGEPEEATELRSA